MASGGRFQRAVEKHVINHLTRPALKIGIAPRAFALIETVGRRTGQKRSTPIGGSLIGSSYWLVAEHGTECDYVKNLLANSEVRLKVGRQWHQGRAVPLYDDDAFARREALDQANGLVGRIDGVIFRAASSTPVTIRIDLDGS